jgi:hypothetical protein
MKDERNILILFCQALFFFPCVILDGFFVILILTPIWIITGANHKKHTPLLTWLMDKETYGGNK